MSESGVHNCVKLIACDVIANNILWPSIEVYGPEKRGWRLICVISNYILLMSRLVFYLGLIVIVLGKTYRDQQGATLTNTPDPPQCNDSYAKYYCLQPDVLHSDFQIYVDKGRFRILNTDSNLVRCTAWGYIQLLIKSDLKYQLQLLA